MVWPPANHQDVADEVEKVRIAGPKRALGKLLGGLAVRKESGFPCRVVFVGSSTPAGQGASTLPQAMPSLIVSALQRDYPSGIGTETATIYSTTAAFGTLSTQPGVHGYSAGIGSTTSATYLTTTTRNAVIALQPRMIIHCVGSNDMSAGTVPATYKANVKTNVDAFKAGITTPLVQVLLHAHHRLDVPAPTYSWATYLQQLVEIATADSDNVAVVDASVTFALNGVALGGTDPYNLVGADNIHLTNPGHALLADVVYARLGTVRSASGELITVYSADEFARADGATVGSTTTGGFAWTSVDLATAYSLLGGTLRQSTATSGVSIAQNDTRSDGTYQVTIPSGGSNQGLFFGGTSNSVGYYFMHSSAAGAWRFGRLASKVYTAVTTGSAVAAPGANLVLSVTKIGTRFICRANGTTILDTTDATYSNGTFSGVTSAGSAATFDSFSHTSSVAV